MAYTHVAFQVHGSLVMHMKDFICLFQSAMPSITFIDLGPSVVEADCMFTLSFFSPVNFISVDHT